MKKRSPYIPKLQKGTELCILDLQSAYTGVTSDQRRDVSRNAGEMTKEKWSDVLIVTDTADSMEKIDDLVNELDVRVPQVMIETRMVELSLNDIANIGIDWQAKHSPSKSIVGMEMPSSETQGIDIQTGTLSIRRFKDIMLRIQVLETSGRAKLISNPSIITLDNELAQMDAMPEVNSIKEWTVGENPQPIISSRMTHTRVRIKDGQTFVIGGLIKDEQRETVSRVPILHAVPLIGRLFRTKSTDNVKTDLVVFITPRICKDDT